MKSLRYTGANPARSRSGFNWATFGATPSARGHFGSPPETLAGGGAPPRTHNRRITIGTVERRRDGRAHEEGCPPRLALFNGTSDNGGGLLARFTLEADHSPPAGSADSSGRATRAVEGNGQPVLSRLGKVEEAAQTGLADGAGDEAHGLERTAQEAASAREAQEATLRAETAEASLASAIEVRGRSKNVQITHNVTIMDDQFSCLAVWSARWFTLCPHLTVHKRSSLPISKDLEDAAQAAQAAEAAAAAAAEAHAAELAQVMFERDAALASLKESTEGALAASALAAAAAEARGAALLAAAAEREARLALAAAENDERARAAEGALAALRAATDESTRCLEAKHARLLNEALGSARVEAASGLAAALKKGGKVHTRALATAQAEGAFPPPFSPLSCCTHGMRLYPPLAVYAHDGSWELPVRF